MGEFFGNLPPRFDFLGLRGFGFGQIWHLHQIVARSDGWCQLIIPARETSKTANMRRSGFASFAGVLRPRKNSSRRLIVDPQGKFIQGCLQFGDESAQLAVFRRGNAGTEFADSVFEAARLSHIEPT